MSLQFAKSGNAQVYELDRGPWGRVAIACLIGIFPPFPGNFVGERDRKPWQGDRKCTLSGGQVSLSTGGGKLRPYEQLASLDFVFRVYIRM